MKPINTKIATSTTIVGFILLAFSFLLQRLGVNETAYCFISGFGCSWIGLGIIGIFIKKHNPEKLKQMEIEQKDERNIRIREKSGYMSYLITLFFLAVLEFTFLIMDNKLACLLTIVVMAIHITVFFISLNYYNKKM